MRRAQIIGRVTLSVSDPALKAGRWLVASPLDSAHLNTACQTRPPVSSQSSLITYDSLGAGEGDIVGIVEGAEATAPFDHPIPIDAITVAIFDSISHQPATA
jgi:ethanolamine utilization protein EutN